MELANNTWNKGLLMDTHPMMLGNDSMTDCLNGTLITMNGNEVILQNDMGNRRIDHAFLPSGYEPVGIKEHGGVIYVASYNPITNKSLIGSFPSPERIIDINDDDNLKNNFDFDSFFKEKTSEGGNIQKDLTLKIPVMVSDSFLIPLTPKNKLHVGDIFTVYSPHLSSLAPDLTNYDNILYYSEWEECTKQEYDEITDSNLKKEETLELQVTYYKRSLLEETKVRSPKNRKYTLLLGILNEQNNFNDITSSLVRWNSPLKEVTEEEYDEYKTTKEIRYYIYEDNVWKEVNLEKYNSFIGIKQRKYFIYVPQIIRNLENKSQLYKFNTGYFIPDGFLSDKDIDGEPIDDANLIKSRKLIAANNFSYKLAGPLYLKVSYNHVHSFGYAINGTWDGTKATLKITGYFTYNCPDGVNTINDNGDSDYYTFETGEPTNILFDFFDNNNGTPLKINPDPNTISTSTCIYNKTTNLYTVTLVKEYTIENPESDIYNYVIGVLGGEYNGNNIFYIKDLSSIGQINLRLLNSGAITLKLYKFYNKAETHDTTMTLEFETYPKEGLTFEDMYLKFENIDNQYDVRYLALHLPILNGKLVFSFNWLDSISNDAEGTEYDEDVPYELANIKLKARQTYKVTIHYKDVNTLLNLKINSTYDDGIDRWLLTTELFNDLYSSNLTDYCNKALTDDNDLFKEKLTIAPNSKLVGSLYKVKYGDVTYYNPTYPNDNKAPMYSVLNGNSLSRNIITLYQPVEFKKLANTLLLNVSNYPDYIEDITLNISGVDDNELLLEEITANDYLALQYVYNPLRTVLLLKDRINASFAGYTRAWDAGTDEGAEIIYFYKRSYEEVLLAAGSGHTPAELNPQGIGFTNGWRESGGEDCWLNRNITNYLDLSDINGIDFSTYKGLFFPSVFCLTYAGSDALGWASYIGGPYFAVNRNTSNDEDIIFVKTSPYSVLSDKLINWNEDYTTEAIYKILGNSPALQLKIKSITYSIYLTINARIDEDENYILPYIGNLKFTVDTRTIPNTLDLLYDNGSIVHEYRLYKNRTLDKYIDLNTGNKILDIEQDLYSTNRLFKIEQYKTIKYLGNSIFDKLSYCDDDEGLAYIQGYYSNDVTNPCPIYFENTAPVKVWDETTQEYIDNDYPITFTFSNDIEYTTDPFLVGGTQTWHTLIAGENSPEILPKEVIYWRASGLNPTPTDGIGTFSSTGEFLAGGNIMSLVYGADFQNKTSFNGKTYIFRNLFKDCTNLINVNSLDLPATTLTTGCYYGTFSGTSIVASPILLAEILMPDCYHDMFKDCINLNKVTCLAKYNDPLVSANATENWLNGVAISGEFTKALLVSWWQEDSVNGIPTDWTISEV